MEEGSIQIRAPSPLPDDLLSRIPTQDTVTFQRWLVKLCFFKNSNTLINKLPVELLLEIIEDALDHHKASRSAIFEWSFQLSAMLTICRHWYLVAVFSPSIWAHVSTDMPLSLLETCLLRSRGADLSLDIRNHGYRSISVFMQSQVLTPHLDRVTHMVTYD